MKYQRIARPCKNFCALSLIRITDPRDNREKVAFTSIAQGDRGALVIADYDGDSFESYRLQLDAGAWAIMQLQDGSLLIGTSNYYGSCQRFDMNKREWLGQPLRVDSEEYIWNFALGSDGNVYGGTWPGDRLLCYKPDSHTLEDLGKVSEEVGNNYSRTVYGQAPGKIFISSLFDTKRITAYDIATATFDRNFGRRQCSVLLCCEQYVCTTDDETLEFLDPYTGAKLLDIEVPAKEFEKLSASCALVADLEKRYYDDPKNVVTKLYGTGYSAACAYMNNGDIVGVQGQDVFKLVKGETVSSYKAIDAEPPETFIHELVTGENGLLWGASSLGMTIFSYDTATGMSVNTRSITSAGGEVYGIVAQGGKVYSTAYCWGEHVVYDPTKPWSARDNVNPRNVRTLHPKFIRPYTRSKIDSDGYIWTGWLEEYGKRGLALTKWSTKDDTSVQLFENTVPQTGIFGLDVTEDYVWFTTCNHANGLPDIDDPLSLCAVDKDGNLVFKKTFGQGERLGRVAFAGRYGVVQVGNGLYRIDAVTMQAEALPDIRLVRGTDSVVEVILQVDKDTVAVFDLDETLFVQPCTGKVTARVPSPKGDPKELFYNGVYAAAVCNGDIYATVGCDLYKLAK